MLRSALLSASFFALAIVASLPAAKFGQEIAFAPSARAAAPLAAPFALFASLTAASLSLSFAAACSEPQARRSRRS